MINKNYSGRGNKQSDEENTRAYLEKKELEAIRLYLKNKRVFSKKEVEAMKVYL
jgi:hypothetical protein